MGVVNCTSGNNGDSPTQLNIADIDSVIFGLLANEARFITDLIDPEDKFSSAGLRPAFWGLMHTDVLNDLEKVAGFVPISSYANTSNVLPAEWGLTKNVRWLYSTLGSFSDNASALGNRVYTSFVFGKEAYGCVELSGASAQFIYQGLGAGNDPLNQRQTAGYKFAQVAKILNESWIKQLKCTLS